MLLPPIFGFDTLNLTKINSLVMNLECVRKKHSRTKFSCKPLFSEVFRKLGDVKIN